MTCPVKTVEAVPDMPDTPICIEGAVATPNIRETSKLQEPQNPRRAFVGWNFSGIWMWFLVIPNPPLPFCVFG